MTNVATVRPLEADEHDEMLDNRWTCADIETLAERLGWPAGRVRLTLIQLRDAGHVTYQPGYRSWARTLRDG